MSLFRWWPRLACLAVLAALIVLPAACGDGGGQAASSPTFTSAAGTGPTATAPPAGSPTAMPQSTANFSASATIGEAPLEVSFTNLSENADGFQWDFGDETTASSSNVDETVTHEYTKAGTYQVTLSALKDGQTDTASTATVSISVEAGSLFEVKIEPDALTALPAEEQQFTVKALDQFGNEISDLSYLFSTDEKAGEVDDTGRFTTGTIAGSYSAAVSVEAAQGPVTKSATVDLTIEHGALDRVLLTPETVELGIGEDQDFDAAAVDAYDNPISEAAIT